LDVHWTVDSHASGMNISVLLRLVPASRSGGRLAGQAVVVETGQTFVFAGDAEVIALLDRLTTDPGEPTAAPAEAPETARSQETFRDQSR
jgi:hypothetical protein